MKPETTLRMIIEAKLKVLDIPRLRKVDEYADKLVKEVQNEANRRADSRRSENT